MFHTCETDIIVWEHGRQCVCVNTTDSSCSRHLRSVFCSSVSHLEGVHICINAFFSQPMWTFTQALFSYFFHCPSFVRSFFWFNCFERKISKWFDFLKKNRLRFNTIDHIKENMEISLMEKCMAIIERSSLE